MTDQTLNGAVSRRIAIVAPSGWSLLRLRDDLLRDLASRGHEVVCIAPDLTENEKANLAALGAKYEPVVFDVPGLKFFADRKIISSLQKIFTLLRPDAVLGFGGRPMIYAALAARRAGVARIISLVNGLPEFGLRGTSSREDAAARHYAHALKASTAVVFHNKEDKVRLEAMGLMPKGIPSLVVPGAGINVERDAALPLPPLGEGLVFLMAARLERGRGVGEFASAARALKARAPLARFLLAGPAGSGIDAVTAEALGADGQSLEYLGETPDVRAELARAHVFVYPSRAEGMPRAVQQALAAGRPVIVANTAGSRDAVDECVNGCLFEPGDVAGLTRAMESLLKRPDLLPAMARASRVKAERRFDVREVNAALRGILGVA